MIIFKMSLLNCVGCVGTWVAWVRGLRGYVGYVGCVGQKVAWVAWVTWVYKILAWVQIWRGSKFWRGFEIFLSASEWACTNLNLLYVGN